MQKKTRRMTDEEDSFENLENRNKNKFNNKMRNLKSDYKHLITKHFKNE